MAVPSRLLLTLLIVLLLVAGGWYVYSNRLSKSFPVSKTVQTVTPTSVVTKPTGPYMTLERNKEIYSEGEEVIVKVYANSKQIPITGYDAVITYDPQLVTYEDAKTVTDAFSLYTQPDKNGATSLTGMRPLNDSPTAVDQVVAEVRYKVKKSGKIAFALKYTPGSTADSNLIDTSSKDVLTAVTGADALAGESLTLVPNKPQKAGPLTLTLETHTYMSPNCADCMESATIKVQNGDSVQRIEFRNGGIVGYTDVTQQVFGYQISAVSFSKEGVVVNYSKL